MAVAGSKRARELWGRKPEVATGSGGWEYGVENKLKENGGRKGHRELVREL